MKIKNQQKSFTLIELLVVIAIIGLIASVIFVASKGTKEKAQIAKRLEFSQSVYQAVGANLVGAWNFDEGVGGIARDSSSLGNNGTIYEASYDSETPHKIIGQGAGRYSLLFDNANDYVQVPDNNSLDITDKLTIEAWAFQKGSASNRYQRITDKNNVLGLWYDYNNGGDIHAYLNGNSVFFNTNLGQNKWHHIAVTYDKDLVTNELKLFIDGKLFGISNTYSGVLPTNASSLYIGNNSSKSRRFNGYIDEVRIYNGALNSAQIQKHYVDGLPRHLAEE